jgi:hypothetical protein
VSWRPAQVTPPTPVFFKSEKKGSNMWDGDMPISLWCEFGGWENGHSFSSKDPDYQVMKQTRMVDVPTGNSFGRPTYQKREEIEDQIVICGKHIQEMTRAFHPPTAEIPPTLETLEREDTSYREGYDAAMERLLNRPMTNEEREKLGANRP